MESIPFLSMINFYKKPVVKITWHDACSYETSHSLDYYFSGKKTISWGLLLSKTKKQVVILRDIYGVDEGDPQADGVLVIPKGWIDSIEKMG